MSSAKRRVTGASKPKNKNAYRWISVFGSRRPRVPNATRHPFRNGFFFSLKPVPFTDASFPGTTLFCEHLIRFENLFPRKIDFSLGGAGRLLSPFIRSRFIGRRTKTIPTGRKQNDTVRASRTESENTTAIWVWEGGGGVLFRGTHRRVLVRFSRDVGAYNLRRGRYGDRKARGKRPQPTARSVRAAARARFSGPDSARRSLLHAGCVVWRPAVCSQKSSKSARRLAVGKSRFREQRDVSKTFPHHTR